MKYYTDTNGSLYANPSNLEGLVEVESAVRADGTLLPKHKSLSDLEVKEDGSYYKYYNQDGTADLVKEQAENEAQALADWKASRAEAVANIVVTTTSGKKFDGDEQSQIRMGLKQNLLVDGEETLWSLADTPTGFMSVVTKEELKEACELAGAETTRLWEYE